MFQSTSQRFGFTIIEIDDYPAMSALLEVFLQFLLWAAHPLEVLLPTLATSMSALSIVAIPIQFPGRDGYWIDQGWMDGRSSSLDWLYSAVGSAHGLSRSLALVSTKLARRWLGAGLAGGSVLTVSDHSPWQRSG